MPPPGDWYLWLLQAGRGTGKTDACADYVDRHVKGPPCDKRLPGGHRVAIIAPTLGDAFEACVTGPSGLKAHNPTVRSIQGTSGTHVRWVNGAEAKLFGADTPGDIERLRAGGNRCCAWLEELAAWRHLESTWTQLRIGLLRLGDRPHAVASTTPKPRLLIRALNGRADAEDTKRLLGAPPVPIVITRASTRDNPHLAPSLRQAFEDTYAGTRVGRQELEGELLDDVEGALWQRSWLDRDRVSDAPHPGTLARIVIALDPAGGTADGDEQAIVVAALGMDHRYYVLHSEGVRLSPDAWLRRAAQLHEHFGADRLVYEKNYGDAYLTALIRNVIPHVPAAPVNATHGKRTRAEPISALYEQGKVSHVGRHDVLEDQLCSFAGAPGEPSPDRLDALCIGRGTPITTARGDVAIEDVTMADQVWTRAGWRHVERSGMSHPAAEVLRLSTTVGDLVLTPNHRVFVAGRGFTRADALVCGDRISTCPKHPVSSLSTAARSLVVLIRQLVRGGFTTRRGPTRTAGSGSDNSTSRCGAMRTAAQRFRRALSSTTSTTTHSTTTPPTLSASPEPSMAVSTANGATTTAAPPGSTTWPASGHWLPSGTEAMPGASGTVATAQRHGKAGSMSTGHVSNAARPTNPRSPTVASSAPVVASSVFTTPSIDSTGPSLAPSAERVFGRTSTGSGLRHALASVGRFSAASMLLLSGRWPSNAPTVGRPTTPGSLPSCSVPRPVLRWRPRHLIATPWRSPALFAGPPSGRASTNRSRKPAPARVVGCYTCADPTPVYDLTVADQPEFFANGLLVHNCYAIHELHKSAGGPARWATIARSSDPEMSWDPLSLGA